MYTYKAHVLRTIDGDTCELDVDLGFSIHVRQHVRLLGINAPEHDTAEGKKAAAYLSGMIPNGVELTVETVRDKSEKYGRTLGKLVLKDGRVVNDEMVKAGLAKPYFGGKRE